MPDSVLTFSEKARLTDYAREVVARNARGAAAAPTSAESEDPVDAFSLEGLRRRQVALETRFAAMERRVEQSLSAILITLERIEAKTAHTSGELSAVRAEMDAQAGQAAFMRDELMAAAKDYGVILNSELTELVNRLEKISDADSPKKPGEARGVGRDG